jgi:MSHA biogenesis protein MshQ
MRLQRVKPIFRIITLCVSLLFSLAWVGPVVADVYLDGEIKIGDNDFEPIEPNNMLQENWRTGVFEPIKPIHFNLSESITLTEIQLNGADEISGSLYFVIWDQYNNVIVNRRSASFEFWRSQYSRQTLAAGDYKIAVVGQCFKRTGGSWRPEGWRNTCSSGNRTYDDFSFQGITLKTRHSTDISRSLAFIQRHHIGDSEESRDNGYADRWYPDDHAGSRVDYDFTVSGSRKLQSVTIYHYRDLIAYGNTVKLMLINKDTARVISQSNMSAASTRGDYVWSLNESLIAGTNYGVVIQVTGWGDKDDISWDDVVIKLAQDDIPTIKHYRIQHSVTALTCEPATVTVKACTNNFIEGGTCAEASSSTSATLRAQIKDTNNTVKSIPATFTGTTDIALSYLQPNTLTLSLTNIGTKPYYCNSSAVGGCNITFADIGFLFSYDNDNDSSDIAAQTSGVTFPEPIKLEAFYNEDGKCKNIFDGNQTVNVGLGMQCKDPGTCSGQNFRVDGKVIGRNNANEQTHFKPIALSFNKNSADITPVWFEDAGSVTLLATYTIDDKNNDLDGLTIKGQSNAFWVKPDKFTINATDKDDINRNLNGSSATSAVIYSAGQPFTLTVTAVNRQGDATQNYQPAKPENIEGRVTRLAPIASDSADGHFQYSVGQTVIVPANTPDWSRLTTFSVFKDGVSISTDAAYDEVGIIKFDLRDKDYQGQLIEVAGDGITIGRFTPDHFELVESSVTNYLAAPADVGVSYMSQPALVFHYKLQAKNLGGDPTRNYIGDYNKAEIAKRDEDKVGFVADSDGREATDRLADFSGYWCNGVYQSGSCANYGGDTGQFSRLKTCPPSPSKNCPDGPFMNTYFGIKLEDTDKVKLNDLDMLPASSANSTAKRLSQEKSELRYGRWTIADGYGPINRPFPVSMQLEYFNGKEFVLNKDDSITAFSASAATATFNKKTLDLTGGGTFHNGFTQKLIINAHSHIGDVRLIHTAPVWLQYNWSSANAATDDNPAAIISFGFFRGNDRVIYRRRVN